MVCFIHSENFMFSILRVFITFMASINFISVSFCWLLFSVMAFDDRFATWFTHHFFTSFVFRLCISPIFSTPIFWGFISPYVYDVTPPFLYKFLFEGCFPSLHHENPDASLLCDHGTFTWLINSIPSGDQCGKMSCFLFELIARYCWFMSKVTSLWLCN